MFPRDIDLRPMMRPELAAPHTAELFPGVASRLDIPYAGPPGYRPLTLDLHIPTGGDAAPVVVYAHGGGFVTGTRAMGPWAFLLAAGYAVASVSYRLSGECQFPGPVHDVAAAVRWVRVNAVDHGLDPERVIGFGSSAGAYLITAVALGAADPFLAGELGPDPRTSCRLAAVIDHYAPTDFLNFDADAPADIIEPADAPGTSASRFLGFVPSSRPADAERAALPRRVTPDSPPLLILHGDADRRVGIGQSRRLHEAYAAAGAHSELVVIAGADHGTEEFDQDTVHQQTLAFLATLP